jgi:protein-disulfide isomerase
MSYFRPPGENMTYNGSLQNRPTERKSMFDRAMLRCWAVLMLGILAACGSQPIPASPAPTAAAQPTRAPVGPTAAAVIAPTAAASQAPAAAPTASAAQAGNSAAAIPDSLTPEGYHMLGRPDAPVTLVMYSDFL